MRWFANYRIEWIAEMVSIYGFINREQIIRKFGITEAQASRDLQAALHRYPDLMTYDVHTKRYELVVDEPPANAVRADGGCLYCDADQGEAHRPDCPRAKTNYRHPLSKRPEWESEWQTSHVDAEGVHQIRMLPDGTTERRIIATPESLKG